jgi:hypothetical protein
MTATNRTETTMPEHPDPREIAAPTWGRIAKVSSRHANTYVHIVGLWVSDAYPRSVDALPFCRRVRGACYVGVDDVDAFLKQKRHFDPDLHDPTFWPICPPCLATWRTYNEQGLLP